jgi:amino acid transporter
VTFAFFSCTAGEMVAMTAGEAKEPWKDIPVVISFVYVIQLFILPFVLLSMSSNVNYADPNLSTIWGARNGAMTVSPFVVAIQSSALRGAAKVFNVFFIISAYTAGYELLTCYTNMSLLT